MSVHLKRHSPYETEKWPLHGVHLINWNISYNIVTDLNFQGAILTELESKFDYVEKNFPSRDACIVLTPQPIRDGKVTAARGTSY